jgi:hypothetical protein
MEVIAASVGMLRKRVGGGPKSRDAGEMPAGDARFCLYLSKRKGEDGVSTIQLPSPTVVQREGRMYERWPDRKVS